jgi:hypothetical protein
MWLAWLLWRLNAGPQAKRTDGGAPIIADGGSSRHDSDASDGASDGGGGD